MMVSNPGSVFRLLRWQWKLVLLFTVSSSLVYYAYAHLGWTFLKLPTSPLAIVGAALGIFVSFRTNSAYERWWEGRKLWGRMINSSRHFTTQVVSYLCSSESVSEEQLTEQRKELVYRHAAYVHSLRCLLRQQDPFADEHVQFFLSDEQRDELKRESNLTHALLQLQSDQLTVCADNGCLTEMRLHSFDRTIAALLDIQGGCERIKKTPMPRGYGFIAERLIAIYGVLFPLCIVAELGFWSIPINVLVCLSFALISESGRVLEDPFTMFWNGLPLSNISKMIEVNARQRLGETDLPEIPGVDEHGILM